MTTTSVHSIRVTSKLQKLEMKWKTEIYSYIENVGLVKRLRDDNFSVKNYRIFDMAAWDIRYMFCRQIY